MKKRVITRTVLLTAALAGTMASCQKDEFSNEMVPSQEMSLKEKAHVNPTLRYWIDGVEHNQEFASQLKDLTGPCNVLIKSCDYENDNA